MVFDEDGSLDPTLKFLLYAVLALAIGKMLWQRLAEDVSRWITVDLWNLIADHPWWTGLIAVGALAVLILVGKLLSFVFGTHNYVGPDDAFVAPSDGDPGPDVLTFKMKQLSSMSATGFEQACTDLLARDGFLGPRRVGGAGDLGVDVTAHDPEDLGVVTALTKMAADWHAARRRARSPGAGCGPVPRSSHAARSPSS
ncbi:hypothetical protein QMZ92_31950 [Streptomyces sp. HNM0645]|uniref:restriction endonuclease n=1 Tax=Streptomyces sp. HNM0645 TaxID=2782343 RepID=UPI0024B663E2|nr:restriction endonuclease [Streptomyces sp. HNM0645]MDI9888843.1 hypothetical protein [Streptomyces sp. HNM0645]